jgi:hypothetical protein
MEQNLFILMEFSELGSLERFLRQNLVRLLPVVSFPERGSRVEVPS